MVDANGAFCYDGGKYSKEESTMSPINKPAATVLFGIWGILAILFAAFIALAVLALLKYVRSKDMRQEKAAIRKSLG